MTQRNNNLSVLPFYRNVDEQNHRKPYAYGEIYPFYTPLGNVPPFQIIVPLGTTLTAVYLTDISSGVRRAITSDMTGSGLAVKAYSVAGYSVVVYPAIGPMNLTQTEGRHFLEVVTSAGTYTSDIFTAVADVSGMLRLEWWDYDDLVMDGCRIVYDGTFRNVLWLPTLLGKPEYDFEEEGEQRDGYFFPEKMVSEKRYKCVMLAPEYLCDVMRFIRLSDVVRMVDNYGNEYLCDTFLVTPKWQEQGDLASVDIEFTCDTVAKKVGRGYVIGGHGDYNSDYNNDYNNNN